MTKFKRTIYVSTAWNILLFIALFLQGRIITDVIAGKLQPANELLAGVFDGTIVELLQNRLSIAGEIIATVIIAEIIIFFIVNLIIAKNLKSADVDDSCDKKRIIRFYKYLSLYMLLMILVFVILLAFYGFKALNVYNSMTPNFINKIMNDVQNLILNSKLEIFFNFKGVMTNVFALLQSNEDLNKIVAILTSSYKFLINFKDFWYISSSLVLAYGFYENSKCLNSIKAQSILETAQTDSDNNIDS